MKAKNEKRFTVRQVGQLATAMTDYLMGKAGTLTKTALVARVARIVGSRAEARRLVSQHLRFGVRS